MRKHDVQKTRTWKKGENLLYYARKKLSSSWLPTNMDSLVFVELLSYFSFSVLRQNSAALRTVFSARFSSVPLFS
jgi:hypothetical protein